MPAALEALDSVSDISNEVKELPIKWEGALASSRDSRRDCPTIAGAFSPRKSARYNPSPGGAAEIYSIDGSLNRSSSWANWQLSGNPRPPLIAFGNDNNKTVGVYYTANKWTIFNEDGTAIAPGEKFNILMFPVPIPGS
jgi:hypothetical protein